MPWLHLAAIVLTMSCIAHAQPATTVQDTAALPDLRAAEPQVRDKIRRVHTSLVDAPLEAERWGAYGVVLDVHGYVDAAGDAYDRAHELSPQDFRWPYLHAMLQRETEPEQAVAGFKEAIGLDPTYVPAYLHLGMLHEMLGRPDTAWQLYTQARARDPDNASAHLRLGQLALKRDQIDLALTELIAANERLPNDRAVLSSLARALFRAGRADDARRAAAAARTADSHVVDDPFYSSTRAEAVTVAAMITRARFFRDASRFDEAHAELKRALEVDPDHPQIRRLIISVHLAAGDMQAAVPAYQAALAESPNDVMLTRGLAVALAAIGRFEESLDHLRRLHEANPDDLNVANELAWQLAVCPDATLRDPALAIRLAKQVVEAQATPGSLDTLAAAYAADARFSDAIRTMQRALHAHGPAAPDRYRHRLQLYMAGRPYVAPSPD